MKPACLAAKDFAGVYQWKLAINKREQNCASMFIECTVLHTLRWLNCPRLLRNKSRFCNEPSRGRTTRRIPLSLWSSGPCDCHCGSRHLGRGHFHSAIGESWKLSSDVHLFCNFIGMLHKWQAELCYIINHITYTVHVPGSTSLGRWTCRSRAVGREAMYCDSHPNQRGRFLKVTHQIWQGQVPQRSQKRLLKLATRLR